MKRDGMDGGRKRQRERIEFIYVLSQAELDIYVANVY